MGKSKSNSQNSKSNDLCRTLFEAADDAILVLHNGQIVDCNARVASLFNCSQKEIIGQTLLNFAPPNQPEGCSSAEFLDKKLNAGLAGKPQRFEWTYQPLNLATADIQAVLKAVPFNGDTYFQISFQDISRPRQVETAPGEGALSYRNLVESTHDIMQSVGPDGSFYFVNRAWYEILGYSKEEMGALTLFDIIHPDSINHCQALFSELMGGKEKVDIRATFQSKNGQPVTVDGIAKTEYLENGSPITHTFLRDVTTQVKAEESLRQSEARIRMITETALDALIIMNEDGVIDEWSLQAEVVFGWKRSEVIGKTTAETIIPPQYREAHERGLKHFLATGEGPVLNQRIEISALHRNGHEFPVELSISPFQDGGVWTFSAFVRDITKRKQAEQVLKESEQRLSLHVQQTPMAYIEWNVDFEVTAWNPAAEAIFGYSKDEAMGHHAAGLIVPASARDIVDQVWSDLLQQRGGTRSTNDNITKDGRVITSEWYNTPLAGQDGNVIGVASLVQDVTEKIQLEQQIGESLERRERQVQISSQVSQEIATITNEQDLYGRLVTVIREQFGYYNVQLYQYNAQENVLNIAAGAGGASRQMQAAKYQIAVGQGAVGAAAARGTPVLYRDVAEVADWQPNPYLPDTQSEITIPIKLGAESAEIQKNVLQYFVDNNQIDAVIVAAINPIAAASITNQALQKNMPVIACTSNLGTENQTSLVWAIEYDMGRMLGVQAGEWAREHISKGQTLKVGVLNYRIIPQVIERENGILQGIKDVFGENVEIVGNETAADAIQALPIAERWLKEHPDMQMIVGINDACVLGAYRAVNAAGKNEPDRFFVGGIDATDEAIAAIKSGGAYQATVDQPPAEMGVRAIRALVGALTGKPYLQTYELMCSPVNITNVDDFIARKARGAESDEDDALAGVNLNGVKVGLSVMSLTNPFFVQLVDAARAEADRFGLELIVNEPKQVLGVLAVQSNQAGGLDLEDQLALEGLSGQIAIAIENLRLLDEASIFRQFAEASGQGLAIGSVTGEIIYVNPTLLNLLGESDIDQVTGTSVISYHPADIQDRIRQEILPVVMEKGQWTGELTLQSADGKQTPTIENFFIIYGDSGQPRYIADMVTDITEQKQSETELETRLHELDALQRLMTREGWQTFGPAQDQTSLGYLFDQHTVQPVTSAKDVGNGQLRSTVPTQPSPDNNHALSRSVSVRGEIIGQLGIYDDPDQPLQPEDQEFLDSVAEQVAEALERARLLEQTQTALAETENLYEVSSHLNEANDLREILGVVGESGPIPVIDRIALETFERDASGRVVALEVIANWSKTENVQSLPVGSHFPLTQFPHLRTFVTDKPVFFDDIELDTRISPEARASIAQFGLKATAVLPLFSGTQQFGVLVLGSAKAYNFTDREMQPYIALAGQVAVAVENQRLLAETSNALSEAEAAQRRYTVQTWDTYRAKQVEKSYEQSRDDLPAFDDDLPAEVSQAVTSRQTVILTTPPQLSDGEQQDDIHEEPAILEAAQSGVVVPLTMRGEVIGVVGLQETDSKRQWMPEEIALVEAIAEQMAQAAEGIRLLDDSQQRAARERRVNEIGDKIQGAQSLEEALQIAVKEVGLSLEAPQTKVKLSVD